MSHSTEIYQLQRSTDLVTWSNLDQPIPGNNGPVLRSYDLSGLSKDLRADLNSIQFGYQNFPAE